MVNKVLLQHLVVSNFFEVVRTRFSLTKREGEVLRIISMTGVSNRELGDALQLSEKTAKNHVANIQRKMNVRSSRELQAVVFRDLIQPVFMSVFHTTDNITEGINEHASLSS
jgi:DNA-binding CsgD family transcriptional regulator